jgi:hypothetical protein
LNTAQVLTAASPGGVAIIEVRGQLAPACDVLDSSLPPVGEIHLARECPIDELLIARVESDRLHLMPHGGPQIVSRVMRALETAGFDSIDATPYWPHARDDIEARVMACLPEAATPLALNLLLAQPARWRGFTDSWTDEDDARSRRLNSLLHPPTVAVAGPPNIGKSTLLNTLLGRARAVVGDMPGTTRDWVGATVDLAGLIVHWMDAPGITAAPAHAAESAAIDTAVNAVQEADLLIAAADACSGWTTLHRAPDMRVGLRSDLGETPDADMQCAAISGQGMNELVHAIRSRFVSDVDLENPRPWRFSSELQTH